MHYFEMKKKFLGRGKCIPWRNAYTAWLQ